MKEFVNKKSTAIIVIDVQNDYCHEKGALGKLGFDVSPNKAIIPKIRNFLDLARKRGVSVIFTQMSEDKLDLTENHRKKIELTHGDFINKPGSWGYDFCGMKPEAKDLIFRKKQVDCFGNPFLEQNLRERGITNLIVLGVQTAVCVDTTVRSAFTKGFNVVVAEDLVSMTKEKELLHKLTLENLNWNFAYVVPSEKIVEAWN